MSSKIDRGDMVALAGLALLLAAAAAGGNARRAWGDAALLGRTGHRRLGKKVTGFQNSGLGVCPARPPQALPGGRGVRVTAS
jgi:hypothetical protein